MKRDRAFRYNSSFLEKNLSFLTQSVKGAQYFKTLIEENGFSAALFLAWPDRDRVMESDLTADNLQFVDESDDWATATIKASARLECKGVVLNVKEVIVNPGCVQKAHDAGLLLFVVGSEDEQIKKVVKELGVDSYICEKGK